MARLVLVTGGSRSGKSDYAQKLAEHLPGPHGFVATCPPSDAEMVERIRKHQQARSASSWKTIEAFHDLASAVKQADDRPVLLIDCLTLWVSNLMAQAHDSDREFGETDVIPLCRELVEACRNHDGTVIMVTNEVGSGIVPEHPLARRYRDIVGRCNQTIAADADEVTVVVSGIPLHLKKG